jgi:hypothetical protein
MVARLLTALSLLGAVLSFGDITLLAQTKSAGLIVAVEGDVRVGRKGWRSPAVEGFVVEPGDTIAARTGGVCSGFGIDGNPFHIKGPSEMVFPSSLKDGTIDKVRGFISRQLSQWSGASRSRSLVSRSARDWKHEVQSPATLIPGPDGAVRGNEPRFVWTTIPGVDSYVVTIAPDEGDEIKQTVRGHSFVPQDLLPGEGFVWKVEARNGGTSAGSGWSGFRVMAADEEKQLDEAVAGLPELEAGVLLYTVGLHEESVYRFDAAVNAGSQRRSALRWRAQVLAAIGLDKDAYQDLVQTLEW